MFGWLRSLFGGKPQPKRQATLRASYDAAQTTDANERHWSWADSLSARSANSLEVRRTLRERARYESANNSYCRGIVLTLANNLVGPGPRLQVTGPDEVANRQIEAAWAAWARAIRLADKLRTMKQAKTVDGEGFALLVTNPMLPTSVQLDLRLIEADQVASPFFRATGPGDYVDGIEFDPFGNPAVYHVLKNHPGATTFWASSWGYDRLPARSVLHWFRADRPGQARGIPEYTPALPLFAQLRRFTLATLAAAETAANFAALIKTSAPPYTGSEQAQGGQQGDHPAFEIERGMMTFLPEGWEPSQLKAEHPATTYEMAVWCILREICRCLNVPLNIALGDSSKSNFSSARLDHLVYRQSVGVEREDCEREVLEPALGAWLDEATRIPKLLPPGTPPVAAALLHTWHWPAWEPIDPKVEAETEQVRMAAGTGTLAEFAGAHGQDWREVIRQQEAEAAYRAQVRREMGGPSVPQQAQEVAQPAAA